jgi:hypothetical protein
MGSSFLELNMLYLNIRSERSFLMKNFIKMAVIGAVASFIASKIAMKDAKDRADEVMRSKEALLNFATRDQRDDK